MIIPLRPNCSVCASEKIFEHDSIGQFRLRLISAPSNGTARPPPTPRPVPPSIYNFLDFHATASLNGFVCAHFQHALCAGKLCGFIGPYAAIDMNGKL